MRTLFLWLMFLTFSNVRVISGEFLDVSSIQSSSGVIPIKGTIDYLLDRHRSFHYDISREGNPVNNMVKIEKPPTIARPGVQIRVGDLIDDARKLTGLTDFGDLWFMEPLHALVGFINREAGLTDANSPPVQYTVRMLADRLRVIEFINRYPDVLKEKVHVAGVIIAHARGGSTLTQRLLARSPQLNATYFWEQVTPVPLPGEKFGDPSPRIAIGDAETRAWAAAMPEYKSMHPHDSQYHEEDLPLGDRSFLSFFYSAQFNIPSYLPWLVGQDETRSYQEFKRFLQVLQYRQPYRQGRKWILKSIHHTLACKLRTMFETFPETVAIISHRRMDEVIPSLSSIVSTHTRGSGSNSFDRKEMGPRYIAQFVPALKDMMEVRKTMPAQKFIDVHYTDTVSDPIGTFRRLLEGIGLIVTPEDLHEASTWMSKNGRDTHPRHDYKPEDFGVTAKQLQEVFKFYHDAYNII
jgi:hypothetical protein